MMMAMNFSLSFTTRFLGRTPNLLNELLLGLDQEWLFANEGGDSWSPFDVLGHLIHADKTDWIPRIEIILSDGPPKMFPPFDRFAQLEENKGKSIEELLTEFSTIRKNSLERLDRFSLSENDLSKTAMHPAFGEVQLKQLLATWVVHDLNHLNQINRTLATQWKTEVGPWQEYLRILK